MTIFPVFAPAWTCDPAERGGVPEAQAFGQRPDCLCETANTCDAGYVCKCLAGPLKAKAAASRGEESIGAACHPAGCSIVHDIGIAEDYPGGFSYWD